MIVIALSFFVQSKFAAGWAEHFRRNCSFLYFLSLLAGLESYSCLLSFNCLSGNHDSLDSRILHGMPNDTPRKQMTNYNIFLRKYTPRSWNQKRLHFVSYYSVNCIYLDAGNTLSDLGFKQLRTVLTNIIYQIFQILMLILRSFPLELLICSFLNHGK